VTSARYWCLHWVFQLPHWGITFYRNRLFTQVWILLLCAQPRFGRIWPWFLSIIFFRCFLQRCTFAWQITPFIWNIFSSVYLNASSFSWPHIFLSPSKQCLCASFMYCKLLKQLLCFLLLHCLYLTFPGYKQKLASMREWDRYWNITLTCRVLRFLVLMIHFRFLYTPTILTALMMVVFNHIQVVTWVWNL